MKLRCTRLILIALAVAAFGYSACGSDDSGAASCVPGEFSLCACFDGRSGQQRCNDDGTFDQCVCAGGPSSGGTGGTVISTGGFTSNTGGFTSYTGGNTGSSIDQNFTSCLADFCPPSNWGTPCCRNNDSCGVDYNGDGSCEQRQSDDIVTNFPATGGSGGMGTGGTGGTSSGDSGTTPEAGVSDSGTGDGGVADATSSDAATD